MEHKSEIIVRAILLISSNLKKVIFKSKYRVKILTHLTNNLIFIYVCLLQKQKQNHINTEKKKFTNSVGSAFTHTHTHSDNTHLILGFVSKEKQIYSERKGMKRLLVVWGLYPFTMTKQIWFFGFLQKQKREPYQLWKKNDKIINSVRSVSTLNMTKQIWFLALLQKHKSKPY